MPTFYYTPCGPSPCIPFSSLNPCNYFTVATKDAEADKALVPGRFSDNFTPHELCDWLGAVFKEKGLELREQQRDIFISKCDNLGWQTFSDIIEAQSPIPGPQEYDINH